MTKKIRKNTGKPILPTKAQFKDPTKQGSNRKRAISKLGSRYSKIRSEVKKAVKLFLSKVPRELVSSNIVANKNTYTYDIDNTQIGDMSVLIKKLLEKHLDTNGNVTIDPNFWLSGYVNIAYDKGASEALQSTKNISTSDNVGDELSIAIRSTPIESLIFDPQYKRRVELVAGRTFNLMQGLTDSTRSDLVDTLSRGMANGKGIKEITDSIVARIKVSKSRAERIARTEINNAYRTANRQEMTEINNSLFKDQEYEMKLLWFSALSSTTRLSHASRHGKTYTAEEVAAFYSEGGNSINCLCSQTQVLVDKQGNIFQEDVIKEMKEQKIKWKKQGLVNNSHIGSNCSYC